jgi:hypothetical protein
MLLADIPLSPDFLERIEASRISLFISSISFVMAKRLVGTERREWLTLA